MKNNKHIIQKQPQYNMWHNSAYMINKAWKISKNVIFLCILLILINIILNIVELVMVPIILEKIEENITLPELLTIIIFFIASLLLLMSLKSYININTIFERITVRSNLINKVTDKLTTTSYPNIENTEVLKKYEEAVKALSSNNDATEAIWNTLENLMISAISLIICLFLLSSLNIFLISIVIILSTIKYFFKKQNN